MAKHQGGIGHVQLRQQTGDGVIGPVGLVGHTVEQHQTTGVFATLLRVLNQDLQVVGVDFCCRYYSKNSAHISYSQKIRLVLIPDNLIVKIQKFPLFCSPVIQRRNRLTPVFAHSFCLSRVAYQEING